MDDSSLIIWSMLLGSVGLGFFLYGKKQKKIVPLVTGMMLFIFPYFVPNLLVMLVIGAVICSVPYFIRF